MKILYSVQATGNGHISRAMELLPYIKQYGHVDIFLSGANSTLPLQAPVKYRSKGISLFYACDGSLSYRKMLRHIHPLDILKQVNDLPVEQYDLVLNDFECITALACAKKKVPSINFGHQASFMSEKTPRPEKRNAVGEWVLKNYARATQYIGLHFENYDEHIFSPVIKEQLLHTDTSNKGHLTVYLPSYCEEQLFKSLSKYKDFVFEVFSHETKMATRRANILFLPVNKEVFNESLIHCAGLITGGGFETPAEALHLKKKLMVLPIKGQYEQQCNAAALKRLGIPVLKNLDDDLDDHFPNWAYNTEAPKVIFRNTTEMIISEVMAQCKKKESFPDLTYPELVFY
jgi:uncharacterized protein (TIGR00661 family)